MIWHYTIGPKLALIAADRALRPTSQNIAPGERPILWCSSDPQWERSCAKQTIDPVTGAYRWMSFEEHTRLLLVRFRVPLSRVVAWPKIGRRAEMPAAAAAALERTAREMGADPRRWYGSLKPIGIRLTAVEAYAPDDGWIEVGFEDALEMGIAISEAYGVRMAVKRRV